MGVGVSMVVSVGVSMGVGLGVVDCGHGGGRPQNL